jgi:hypothetical protein
MVANEKGPGDARDSRHQIRCIVIGFSVCTVMPALHCLDGMEVGHPIKSLKSCGFNPASSVAEDAGL